jgi:DNA processing protein
VIEESAGSGPSASFQLRRPSDIAAEGGRRGRGDERRDEAPDRVHLAWPPGFVATSGDRQALLVLAGLASMTARRLLELANEVGSAEACLEAVRRGEAGSDGDRRRAAVVRPEEVAARLDAVGGRFVVPYDSGYPESLLDLFDPPAGLFVRGEAAEPAKRSVAIVGARNCSPGGAELADQLARALSGCGVTIVSGGARGIDAAAHRGAVEAGGRTIAVMGCGIDVAYPSLNRSLFDSVLARGAIVSEYPPGTPAEPFRFPARNRIVAGLSEAVVVVEGATGSGSMITAEHALDLGREVFAVPGAVTAALSEVPLLLIREGATMIRGPDDLIADLGVKPVAPTSSGPGSGSGSGPGSGPGLDRRESAVWEALGAPSPPDGIASRTGLALPEVVSTLVGLELRGLVRQVGGRYERRPGAQAGERPG